MRVGAGLAALCACALLGACAAGGPLPAPPTAPGARTETVPGADGTPLALSHWEPDGAPAAVILAVHGFGDYGPSTFRRAAEAWAAAGIATYAYDQRGFGRNPSRGFWPGAATLAADLAAVARSVRARHPCAPLTVVGHSMGGGVALAAAPALDGIADGLVLAAPAIWGGDALNPVHRAAAWLTAAFVPEQRISGRGIVRIQPSDNIAMLRALGRDPLYVGPPSAREILGLVRVVDLAAESVPQARLPTLLLLGAKDQIVPNRTVARVFETLPGARETIRYEEGWHMLFRDFQAARVWADVAAWSRALPPPAGCATPAGPG